MRARHLFYPDIQRDYFHELSAQQAAREHEIDVLTWKRNGLCSEIVDSGFTIHRLPGPNLSLDSMIQEFPYLPGLPAEMESLRPEIVHADSRLFLTTVQAIRKARKLGLPSVVTVHGFR